jgi:hypothetical protein
MPNGRKIFRIVIKYTNIFFFISIPIPSKIYPSGIFGTKINHLANLVWTALKDGKSQFWAHRVADGTPKNQNKNK